MAIIASGGDAIDFAHALCPDPADRPTPERAAGIIRSILDHFNIGPTPDLLALHVAVMWTIFRFWGMDPIIATCSDTTEDALEMLREYDGFILDEIGKWIPNPDDPDDGDVFVPSESIKTRHRAFAAWLKVIIDSTDGLSGIGLLIACGNSPMAKAIIAFADRSDETDHSASEHWAILATSGIISESVRTMEARLTKAIPHSGPMIASALMEALPGMIDDLRSGFRPDARERIGTLKPIVVHKHCQEASADYVASILDAIALSGCAGDSNLQPRDRTDRVIAMADSISFFISELHEARTGRDFSLAILGNDNAKLKLDLMADRLVATLPSVPEDGSEDRTIIERAIASIRFLSR